MWWLLNPANNRLEQNPGVLGKEEWEEKRLLGPLALGPGRALLGPELRAEPETGPQVQVV